MSQDRHLKKVNRSIECDNLKCNSITMLNNGNGTSTSVFAGQFYAIDGSEGSPSYAFLSNPATGLYVGTLGGIRMSVNGENLFTLNAVGVLQIGNDTFTGSSIIELNNDGASNRVLRYQTATNNQWTFTCLPGANPDFEVSRQSGVTGDFNFVIDGTANLNLYNGNLRVRDGTIEVGENTDGDLKRIIMNSTGSQDILFQEGNNIHWRIRKDAASFDISDQINNNKFIESNLNAASNIGFLGHAPVVRRTAANASNTAIVVGAGVADVIAGTSTFGGYTIDQIVGGLTDLGLFA